jgi:uncharacterized protein
MVAADAAIRLGQFRQAATLLQNAANSGEGEAQYLLSSFYQSGLGVSQNHALAFKWMKAAAEQGYSKAQFSLAKMYLSARGVPFNLALAKSWLQKAASKGDKRSSKLLADIAARPPMPPKSEKAVASDRSATKDQTGPKIPPSIASDAAIRNGLPAISDAAWRGDDKALRQLISGAANITIRDEDGNTPLALASAAGKLAALDVLISAGADLNSRNKAGETALILASAGGHAAKKCGKKEQYNSN